MEPQLSEVNPKPPVPEPIGCRNDVPLAERPGSERSPAARDTAGERRGAVGRPAIAITQVVQLDPGRALDRQSAVRVSALSVEEHAERVAGRVGVDPQWFRWVVGTVLQQFGT